MRVVHTLDLFDQQGYVRTITERSSTPGTFDLEDPLLLGNVQAHVSPDGQIAVLDQALGDGGHQLWRASDLKATPSPPPLPQGRGQG